MSAAGPSGVQTLPDQPSLALGGGMTQPHTTQVRDCIVNIVQYTCSQLLMTCRMRLLSGSLSTLK